MRRLPAPLRWLLTLALLAGLIWAMTKTPDYGYSSYNPWYHTSRPAPAIHRPSLWQRISRGWHSSNSTYRRRTTRSR